MIPLCTTEILPFWLLWGWLFISWAHPWVAQPGMPDADMRGFFIHPSPPFLWDLPASPLPWWYEFHHDKRKYRQSHTHDIPIWTDRSAIREQPDFHRYILRFQHINFNLQHFIRSLPFFCRERWPLCFVKRPATLNERARSIRRIFDMESKKILKMLSALLPRQPPNLRLWRLKTLLTFLSFYTDRLAALAELCGIHSSTWYYSIFSFCGKALFLSYAAFARPCVRKKTESL